MASIASIATSQIRPSPLPKILTPADLGETLLGE
jgi:hypothetical protein